MAVKATIDITHPHLLLEWDYSKNNLDPNTLTFGMHVKVWWKCSKNHEWLQSVNSRTNNRSGCPYCCGQKVCDQNRLSIKYPEINNYWDAVNNKLNPEDYSFSSHQKIYLICKICSKSHQIQINHIRGNFDCTNCRDKHALNKPDQELLNLCSDKIEVNNQGKLTTRYWLPYKIKTLKALAKQRGKEWRLSNLEAGKLLIKPCYYCARYLHQKMGIDRVDNYTGYVLGNCVSCCWQCNNAKSDYSIEEFKSWIIRVYYKSGNSLKECKSICKYRSYKKRTEKRKIDFLLSESEYNNLVDKLCYYCNAKSFGIDRLDSKLGYQIDNCVPCCGECNQAKLTLTLDQFNKLIKLLYNNIDNF